MPKKLSKAAKRRQPPPQLSPQEAAAKSAGFEQHINAQNAHFPRPRSWSTDNMVSVYNDDELNRLGNFCERDSDWAAVPYPYVDTLFTEIDYPTTWDEKRGDYTRIQDPRVWPLSCLDWIATFAESGASAADTKKYIEFHVDERQAGRGTPDQKAVGAEVLEMVSWDLMIAFHNWRTVGEKPGCVLLGSWEAAEAGRMDGEMDWAAAVIDVVGDGSISVVGMAEGLEELRVKNWKLLRRERQGLRSR